MFVGDIFFNCKVGCVDDYVASVGYSDGEVVWEEVFGKLGFEDLCNVSCDYSSDCGWYSYGSEFGDVCGVFVEAEEVYVGEVVFDGVGDVVSVDLVEDVMEVSWDFGEVEFYQVDEKVSRVSHKADCFVFDCVFDGGTYVSWEVEWLDRFYWCSVAWVGCGLYVEFVDDVNVVVIYYCYAGCFTCSGDGYSHLIAVSCLLGRLVVCVCGWVGVLGVSVAFHGVLVEEFNVS